MSSVTLDQIVFDDSIYPRASWSQATVDRYVDAMRAGEHFPPIILEADTNRLLDGKHRTEAYRITGRQFIAVDHHEIPEGVPAELYAASLSSRHGDTLSGDDKRGVARRTAEKNPGFSTVLIASRLGVSHQTVGRYLADLVERRREVRAARVLLLTAADKTQKEIADHLALSQPTVSRIQNAQADNLNIGEDVLREAAADLPIDAEPVIAAILAERDTQTPEPAEPPSTAPAGSGSAPAAVAPGSSITAPSEPEPELASPPRPITPPPGSPAAWTDEERAANQREIDRKRMIADGQKAARQLVTTIRAEISTVVSAIDLGEKDLITAEMIADLRRSIDLLESRLEANR